MFLVISCLTIIHTVDRKSNYIFDTLILTNADYSVIHTVFQYIPVLK